MPPQSYLSAPWTDQLVIWLGLAGSLVSAVVAVLTLFGVRQLRLSQRQADARRVLAVWGPIGPTGACGVKVINSSDTNFRGLVTVTCSAPSGSVARVNSVPFEPNSSWTSDSTMIHEIIDHDPAHSQRGGRPRPANHDGEIHPVQVTYSDGRRYWLQREGTVERLDRLVIWAERTRADTIGSYLGRRSPFLRQTSVRVKVVRFSRTEHLEHAVRQLAAEGGTEDGTDLPDIVVGPHDWIGGVADSRWVEPLPLNQQDQARFHPASVAALHDDGRLVAVPYVFDTVALIRNNRLAGRGPMPSTLPEVIASGQQAVAGRRVTAGSALAMQVGQPNSHGEAGDPYHMWPLFSSAGGSFFGLRRPTASEAAPGAPDSFDDLQTWRGDFIEAFAQLAALGCGPGARGVLDPRTGRTEAIDAFLDQRAPYLICSSRALKRINQKGMDVTVAPVPPLGPHPAVPMVSVYGFFIYRCAPNMPAARDVLTQYLASTEAGVDLQRFQPLVPVQRAAMGRVGDADRRLAPYVEQSRHGLIMPSYPEMRQAWNLLGLAEYRILAGDGDPRTIAGSTADAGWELLSAARQPSR